MTLIAEQTVKARPVEAALGRTNKGGEQVAIAFQLLEGPDEGKHVTWYGYFTEKTLDRTLESLEYCGWAGDDLSNLANLDREVYLVIEHEQDQEGQLRARVRWINASGGVALANRLNETEAAAFGQRMRGAVLARRQAKGQPSTPRTNTQSARREPPLKAEQRPAEDDIPF
jgi:hypothetical protein